MPKINSIKDAAVIFPSFQNLDFIFNTFMFLEVHTLKSIEAEFYIAIVGIILTVFHVFVLTRKSMLMSSIISVMIGIGICDIASMLLAISMKHLIYNFYRDECTPPFSLFTYRLFWILMHLRDDFIRCSTWLGVIMASIRFMALRFVSRPSFKRVTYLSFGFFATLIIFMISSIISILNSNRTKIIETGTWTAGASCEARSNETWILHELRVSDMFAANNGLLLRIVVFINAVLSRILPCILLPILTLALILEIRRARKTMITSSFSVRKRTERTTALVIFMAGTFFIASLPAGVFSLFQVMYTDVGFL
ncbi:unnamed protein product [Caenorhabditis brenneri]